MLKGVEGLRAYEEEVSGWGREGDWVGGLCDGWRMRWVGVMG